MTSGYIASASRETEACTRTTYIVGEPMTTASVTAALLQVLYGRSALHSKPINYLSLPPLFVSSSLARAVPELTSYHLAHSSTTQQRNNTTPLFSVKSSRTHRRHRCKFASSCSCHFILCARPLPPRFSPPRSPPRSLPRSPLRSPPRSSKDHFTSPSRPPDQPQTKVLTHVIQKKKISKTNPQKIK
jgi:hypothetical protein